MLQGEQKGSSYILIQHKNHQWIERLDGPNRLPSRYSYYDETAKVVEELNRLADHIKRLETVVNDPEALWTNWLRGDVKLPVGIGDVRQYQDHIKRLEETGDALYENSEPTRWDSPEAKARKLREQEEWIKAKEAKP